MTQSNPNTIKPVLPLPEGSALQQSETLVQHIAEVIKQRGGTIGFDEYMDIALNEPGLGYYSAGSRKFGPVGDFITAPELSALFSRCLANQCQQVLSELGGGSILELGAGSGVMAKDLLLELEHQQTLPEQYFILERSADLRERQQALIKETIPNLFNRCVWLDGLPEKGIKGLVLANEVLDTLPVKRFIKSDGEFKELGVGLKDNNFVWFELNTEPGFHKQLLELEQKLSTPLPEGYCSEFNTGLKIWLDAIQQSLTQGVMLFIDYGYSRAEYFHPQRTDGSLLCHYRHRVHSDPFFYPGLQDITCSVDFTSLAESADALGMFVSGYTNQTYFLFGCGLDEFVTEDANEDIKTQTLKAQQVRTLTMPEDMGERFKAMALTKNYENTLRGFSIMDQRARL